MSNGQERRSVGLRGGTAVLDAAEVVQARPRPGDKLPAGHHRFSREFVLRSQRERLLDGVARAVAEKGYEKASVADVLQRAGVSRKTFYEHFAGKEECFLAAYETIFGDIAADAMEAYRSRRRWPDRIAAGLEAFVDRLVAEPAYARAGIVEVLAAGPRAIELRDRLLRSFHTFFDASRPEVPNHGATRLVAEAAVGGIYEVIYRRIVSRGSDCLSELMPQFVYLALAPFVGPAEALKTARAGARGQPRTA